MPEKKKIKVAIVRGETPRRPTDNTFPFALLHIARYLKHKGKDLPLDIQVLPEKGHEEEKGKEILKNADVIIQSVARTPKMDVPLIKKLRKLNPKALHIFGGPSHPLISMGRTFETFRHSISENHPDVLIKGLGLGSGVDPVLKIIRYLYKKFGKVSSGLITKENANELLEIVKRNEPRRINPGAGVMLIDKKGKEYANNFEIGVDTLTNLNDSAFISRPIKDNEEFMSKYPSHYRVLEDRGKFSVEISTSNGCPGACFFCDPIFQAGGRFIRMNEVHFKEQFKNAIDAAKEYGKYRKTKRISPLHTISINIANNELSFSELKWIREEVEKIPEELRKKLHIRTFMRSADITDPHYVKKNTPDFDALDEVGKIKTFIRKSRYLEEIGKLRKQGVEMNVFLGGDYFSDETLRRTRKGVTLGQNKAAILGLADKGIMVHLSAMPWIPVDPEDWGINIEHMLNIINIPETFRQVWGEDVITGKRKNITHLIGLANIEGLYPRGLLGRATLGDKKAQEVLRKWGEMGKSNWERKHVSDVGEKPKGYVGVWGMESKSELLVPDWSPEGFKKVNQAYSNLLDELEAKRKELQNTDNTIDRMKRDFVPKTRLHVRDAQNHFLKCFKIKHPNEALEMKKRL
jgi:hypothetical protein